MKCDELDATVRKYCAEVDIVCEDLTFNHIGKCCEGLTLSNNRKYEDWEACIKPYLPVDGNDERVKTVVDKVHVDGIANLTPDKVDPEDEEEGYVMPSFLWPMVHAYFFIKHLSV